MIESGYYRFPTIHQDTVVFVCEDDLWSVPVTGGFGHRLTANLGRVSRPALSPDGSWLAFTGRDEGDPEVYVMSAVGGPATRLTYLGADTEVIGWYPDGQSIIFGSNVGQPFSDLVYLYQIPYQGGQPNRLPTGPAMSISFGPIGGRVIGRHTTDLARWKRYRGGLTGDLWIDPTGQGVWRRLLTLAGNVAMPRWVGERIYFVSDHEGVGNLYSCQPTGEDLQRHTDHQDYYVRHPNSDGRRIVYHAGADLYLFDPATNQTTLIPVDFHSPQVQRNRRFVEADDYLEEYAIHPQGHSVAIVSRGKPFSMANWEQAVIQHGELNGVRYRLVNWLADGQRLIMVSDAAGEERLEIHWADGSQPSQPFPELPIGRPIDLKPSPTADQLVVLNHRHEMILVDFSSQPNAESEEVETEAAQPPTSRVLDRSRYRPIWGVDWSPDGKWLAYSFYNSQKTAIIKLCQVETGEIYPVTRTVLRDVAPSFDPDGKYLYFLSYRDFDPVYDNLHFDLNFPWGMRPFLITLQADLPSPFVPQPAAPGDKSTKKDDSDKAATDNDDDDEEDDGDYEAEMDDEIEDDEDNEADNDDPDGDEESNQAENKEIRIDLEGIIDRVLVFPVADGRYRQIWGLKDKVIFSSYPVEGTLNSSGSRKSKSPPAKGYLEVYDFEEHETDDLLRGITDFEVSLDHKTMIYRAGSRLRVIKAGSKPDSHSSYPERKSGWLDLSRLRLSVQPQAEWEQMFREAWRLQRDYFWSENMAGIDWPAVYERYLPLVKRVATRSEFSDLMWEMQGELGTSHAYEYGGDYRPSPDYAPGFLGVDWHYNPETERYHIGYIVKGDVWDERVSSPLSRPGLDVQVGDRLVAINGRPVNRETSPPELLVNQCHTEVFLTLTREGQEKPHTISVKTLASERPARYRDWVEANRRRVHEATDGQVGYVHLPDMGPAGYAEFHRGYLAEVTRQGLIVDVRFNDGGHVSQLILEKLARRRLGYDVQRWGEPIPYPENAVLGPMVALCNEQAGSDGDVFSHVFKLMQLGPLIGKRTWGGVIGITINEMLVDGGVTTQPEFSFWFKDVGWGVENYGTEPDIEVEISPTDYVAGRDPQIERAIEEVRRLMQENPPELPEFGNRPSLALPKLPAR